MSESVLPPGAARFFPPPPCPSPYYLFRYQYSGSLALRFSPAS
jgi:hypothetical protein